MRQLPRLPDGASADEKIRIIYDWLYELQMELKDNPSPPDGGETLTQGSI